MTDLPQLLGALVRDHPRQRITLAELRAHVAVADPASTGDPDARRHLLAALQALAVSGDLTLPAPKPANWDSRSLPALPLWITRPPRQRQAPVLPSRVWPTALEPAAAIANRPDELALLEAVARWLRDETDLEPVPVQERSLQILGHEKALAKLRPNRLFSSGALSLELLRCYETPLPFASQHVPGTGPTRLLVSENNAGYHSLLTATRMLPGGPDLHVAWGGGKQFPVSIAGVQLLRPRPAELLYVGDLDLAGLLITAASARAAEALGLPPLRPAATLYRAMRQHGVPRDDPSNPGMHSSHDTVVTWLPADLQPFVLDLLTTREKIAQETVGLRLLRAQPRLLAAL